MMNLGFPNGYGTHSYIKNPCVIKGQKVKNPYSYPIKVVKYTKKIWTIHKKCDH